MISLTGFLAFLLPLPASSGHDENPDLEPRRRHAIESLRLSPHLLQDIGMEAYESPADDPRWTPRPDLLR